MIEQIILHISSIDDAVKAMTLILRTSGSPIVIISMGFFLTIIYLVKKPEPYISKTNDGKVTDEDIKKFVILNKKLISEGQTKEVINNLLRFDFNKRKEWITKTVILISARYQNNLSKTQKGFGNNEELNKINSSLLDLLDSI